MELDPAAVSSHPPLFCGTQSSWEQLPKHKGMWQELGAGCSPQALAKICLPARSLQVLVSFPVQTVSWEWTEWEGCRWCFPFSVPGVSHSDGAVEELNSDHSHCVGWWINPIVKGWDHAGVMFVIVPLSLFPAIVVIFVIQDFASIILMLKFTFPALLCEYLSFLCCNTNCLICSMRRVLSYTTNSVGEDQVLGNGSKETWGGWG